MATPAAVSSNHARALYGAAVAMGRLLADVEAMAAPAGSPFQRFVSDLTPSQRQALLAFVRVAHTRMLEALTSLGIPPPTPSGSARGAIRTALSFAEIALDEIEPSRLRGYGALSADAITAIERMQADVGTMFERAREVLSEGPESDLESRIERLSDAYARKGALRELELAIREGGLVGLRGALEAIVERAESGTYEVGFFGRVSCGKSSLINALLERPLLPVGVTPVTSVPTRVVRRETPALLVRMRGQPHDDRRVLEELPELVTEERNPGNAKGIVRVTAEVPAARLFEGLALVDTPGVGALAAAGARETYAYLPRCDLGILVVDGGGGLTDEDVTIATTLRESGIEVAVVLSKADALAESDREKMEHYVHDRLMGRLGHEVDVHWVSSIGAEGRLARAWFDEVLAPQIARAKELSAESVDRKIAALLSIAQGGRALRTPNQSTATVDRMGAEGARLIERARRDCDASIARGRAMAVDVIRSSAVTLRASAAPAGEVVADTLRSRAATERERAQSAVMETRDRVRRCLVEAAACSGAPLDPEVLTVDLTGLPSLEVPRALEQVRIVRPWWRPSAERFFEDRLVPEVGGLLQEALGQFESSLRTWARTSFVRLLDQLGSQLDPLRALGSAPSNDGKGDAPSSGRASDRE